MTGDKLERVAPFDAAAFDAATVETARLQRELDVTNADHIALWIEANTLPYEPMNQCTSWLACRVADAHDAAIAAYEAEAGERERVIVAEVERLRGLIRECRAALNATAGEGEVG